MVSIDTMIKNRVSEYMGIKKMSKREITKVSGIDRHVLDRIYKGEVKGIKFETLNKL